MREVLSDVERWLADGKDVALATVVEGWGSAPRRPGSKMAVSSAGEVTGSVSGGCVESAVVEQAQEVIREGQPRLLHYGVSDDQAWEIGLSCGGTIEVWVERLKAELFLAVKSSLADERPVALTTLLGGAEAGGQLLIWPSGESRGQLGDPRLEQQAHEEARRAFSSSQCRRATLDAEGESADLFVDLIAPRPKLVIVGAGHVAIPLVSLAKTLGFRTHVVDPRSAFATPERFGEADELIVEWPQEALPRIGLGPATYVAVLSHDPKIDLPALVLALRSPARYVGVLGSRKTFAQRAGALEREGFAPEEIARIHAPIGLDLGGRRPEEIAVAIAAEIVAASHGTNAGKASDRLRT